jgi:branched-chain amino acid transport system substrate-binding protein
MHAMTKRGNRAGRAVRASAVGVALALLAGACSSDDSSSSASDATDAPATTPAPDSTDAPDTAPEATDASTDSSPVDTAAPTTVAGEDPGVLDDNKIFPTLSPPTGEPIVLGLVNTEGTPGLDFPEIRLDIAGAVDYLNQHGGIGGRPVEVENCTVNGSPEPSQSCAQELTGKGVELVMLGLDLFPDYATYTAAGVPVVGVLPILPGDYTANALFLTGGNATTMAAAANVAKNHFGATTVGIISADNAGGNSTLASLTGALDKAGITYTSVKGGDTETDAGFQGLMRQAAEGDPDLLFSLYSDAGCIGTMRGRASLGIEIPVLTTGICSGAEVIDQVGDDAIGWSFIGVSTQEDTPELAILQDIMGPVLGVDPSEVDSTALGLGGLGLFLIMSIAVYGNQMAAAGLDVTGQGIYDYLGSADGLTLWPGGAPIDCGAAAAYPTICSFTFPFAEYLEGGEVRTIPGLDAVSSVDYLP